VLVATRVRFRRLDQKPILRAARNWLILWSCYLQISLPTNSGNQVGLGESIFQNNSDLQHNEPEKPIPKKHPNVRSRF